MFVYLKFQSSVPYKPIVSRQTEHGPFSPPLLRLIPQYSPMGSNLRHSVPSPVSLERLKRTVQALQLKCSFECSMGISLCSDSVVSAIGISSGITGPISELVKCPN